MFCDVLNLQLVAKEFGQGGFHHAVSLHLVMVVAVLHNLSFPRVIDALPFSNSIICTIAPLDGPFGPLDNTL